MSYVEDIRRKAEEAPRAALPAVTAMLWQAFGEGHVTEAEAEALSALIEARKVSADIGFAALPQDRQSSPRTGVGSRPRTDLSLERRRRWAASGRLPPALAARFTLAEQAVLSLVAAETARRSDCRLSVPHLAAVAGVGESTVRTAIREARKLGLLTVEARRLTGFRNDTNVVRIVSPEWTAWLRLARKGTPPRYPHDGDTLRPQKRGHHASTSQGGGFKSPNRTSTQVSNQRKTRTASPSQGRVA